MKRLRIFIASLAVFVGLAGAMPPMALAAASAKSDACKALGSNASCTTNPHGSVSLNSIIKTIINVLSWVVGVVAVIMIIYGGFRFVTAGGDSNNVSAARSTVLYAVVGLVVAASAQVIVHFVLNEIK